MREAGPCASLFKLWKMCTEDGPPLSMAGHMRGAKELQALSIVSHLYDYFLLALLRYYIDLAVERGIHRGSARLHAKCYAYQLCPASRNIRYHWLGVDRLHSVAYQFGLQRSDNN